MRIGAQFLQAIHHVDTSSIWKLQINQNNIRAYKIRTADCVLDRSCFRDHFQAICAVHDFSNTTTHDLVVINNHYANILMLFHTKYPNLYAPLDSRAAPSDILRTPWRNAPPLPLCASAYRIARRASQLVHTRTVI